MAEDRLKLILEGTGFPVAYRAFTPYKNNPVPKPPFVVYLYPRELHSGSDSKNFLRKRSVRVELYTLKKDTAAERKIEAALCGFEFEKEETFIDSEALYQVSYEFDIYEKI